MRWGKSAWTAPGNRKECNLWVVGVVKRELCKKQSGIKIVIGPGAGGNGETKSIWKQGPSWLGNVPKRVLKKSLDCPGREAVRKCRHAIRKKAGKIQLDV